MTGIIQIKEKYQDKDAESQQMRQNPRHVLEANDFWVGPVLD